MQSVRSRIWNRVAVSIPCDDNQYTTGTSNIQPKYNTLQARLIDKHYGSSSYIFDFKKMLP